MTEDNALAITIGVPSTRVPERVPLWLECVVPPHALDGGAGYLRALRARLVHTLGRVLPALEGKLALVASAYDGLPPEGPDAAGVSANKPIAIRPRPRCSARQRLDRSTFSAYRMRPESSTSTSQGARTFPASTSRASSPRVGALRTSWPADTFGAPRRNAACSSAAEVGRVSG